MNRNHPLVFADPRGPVRPVRSMRFAELVRIAGLVLFACLVLFAVPAKAQHKADLWGAVGKDKPFAMTFNVKDKDVNGYYVFEKDRKTRFPLKGRLDPSGDFVLDVLDKQGKPYAAFKGRVAGRLYRGTFGRLDGGESEPFSAKSLGAEVLPESFVKALRPEAASSSADSGARTPSPNAQSSDVPGREASPAPPAEIPAPPKARLEESADHVKTPRAPGAESPETFDYFGVGSNTLFDPKLEKSLAEKAAARCYAAPNTHDSTSSANILTWEARLPQIEPYGKVLTDIHRAVVSGKGDANTVVELVCTGKEAFRRSELVFSRFSGKPLSFHLLYVDEAGSLVETFTQKYGKPAQYKRPDMPGKNALVWEKDKDLLFVYFINNQANIAVHFLNNLDAFVEDAKKSPVPKTKPAAQEKADSAAPSPPPGDPAKTAKPAKSGKKS